MRFFDFRTISVALPLYAARSVFVLGFSLFPLLGGAPIQGQAQEIQAEEEEKFSKEHLEAARAAIAASKALSSFNNILPLMAEQTKALFIRTHPALKDEIEEVTSSIALELAKKRVALDHVIVGVWARRFTQKELEEILAFYQSDVGRKLANLSPQLAALSIGAAKKWGDEISIEMVTRVREEMLKRGHEL